MLKRSVTSRIRHPDPGAKVSLEYLTSLNMSHDLIYNFFSVFNGCKLLTTLSIFAARRRL